jgi:uncharacterized repeat protein (TIGR01451 family)
VGPSLFSSVSPAVLLSTDLQISKTGPAVATVNETMTYTLVITNAGPLDAANVSVNDTFPVTLTTPIAFSSRGDLCLTAIGPGATVVTCWLPVLAADEVVTITITTVPTAIGSIVNTASLSYTADPIHDPDISDNSSSFGTDIVSSFSMLPDPLLTAFYRSLSAYQGDS